jgi:pyruvate/2-oxoglutarate dehydrogenase complex dihydrolipoamide acyltransferase (E2) component
LIAKRQREPGGTQARRRQRDRVALSTWSNATESRIGLSIQIEWDRASGVHSNMVPVALVGHALAVALAKNPAANRRVALWNVRSNTTVRLSFAVDAANDLRIAVVDNADTLSGPEFQRALHREVQRAKGGSSPLSTATRAMELLPVFIGRPILRLWSLISAGFGIAMLGIPGAPFGAALISSVGRFGLPAVDVPFVAFTRCALVCSVGSITPTVIARDGVPTVVDTIEVRVSYDHRVCDASQLAQLLADFLSACYSRQS